MKSFTIAAALAAVTPVPAPGQVAADSYADSATARLVTAARAARERNERLVTSYTATVKQRIGVGVRAFSRDRMLYRQEMVAKISWKRDAPSTIELIGAREGVPIALRGDRLPEDLDSQAGSLVLNPAEDYLRLIGGDDDEGFIYPLRTGGEADYRFAAGDTTTITLQNGKRIRLVSLRIIPRRADWRLISGTFWYDAETLGLVQAVFRPARPFEFRRDISEQDREDVPGFVNPTGEVKFITLEYGLYESRWWMPRYVAIDASGEMAGVVVPFRMERVYEDYEVEGGTSPPEGSTFRPAGTVRRREREPFDSATSIADSIAANEVADSISAEIAACVDSVSRYLPETPRTGVSRGYDRGRIIRVRIRACRRRAYEQKNLLVIIPPDTAQLLTSPHLGAPILAMGDLITEDEIRGMADAIGKLPSTPWQTNLTLPRGVSSLLQHARYNRVEALSLGLSGTLDLGPLALRGIGRLGVADLVPNGELSLTRAAPNTRWSFTGYRRLAAANPDTRPFGPVNSTLALLAQRDDGEYYRTLGAEFTAQNANAGWWLFRIFAERQRPAEVETAASLPHLWNTDNAFRPNILADSAEAAGASLTLRGAKPLSRAVQLGAEATVDGAVGDFDLARASATLRLYVTPEGPLAGAVTASAGTSTGTVPTQGRFFLGGPATLRGYAGGVLSGDAYWSARAEIGNSFPAARVTLFTDVGWAGPRQEFIRGRPLIGSGVGASFLDGLVRLDLSRGLRAPTGWRFDFYLDGIL